MTNAIFTVIIFMLCIAHKIKVYLRYVFVKKDANISCFSLFKNIFLKDIDSFCFYFLFLDERTIEVLVVTS